MYSVTGIPMSCAYCEACIRAGADPYWALRANVVCCGGIDRVDHTYLQSKTWIDGHYTTLAIALDRYPITSQELAALDAALEELSKKEDGHDVFLE